MEKTIKRELSAIQHKFDEMVEETKQVEELTTDRFVEMLNDIRCCYTIGNNKEIYTTHVTPRLGRDHLIIAIDVKEGQKVLGPDVFKKIVG